MFYTPALRPSFSAQYVSQPRSADRAFQRMLSNALVHAGRQSTAQAPQISQDEQSVTLAIDVPGLSREQISITVDTNTVRLESVENAPRSLNLAYELAIEIDAEASEAKLENGVLTLKLARKVVAPAARTIAIS